MRALSEMCEWIGDAECAKTYADIHDSASIAYNNTFWNGKYFSDWIDANGVRRDYLFTWHNLLAVIFGIADRDQALSIFDMLDSQRTSLISRFGIPPEQLFCTPSNMFPASPGM